MKDDVRARANQWAAQAHDDCGGQPMDHQQTVSMMTAFTMSELDKLTEILSRIEDHAAQDLRMSYGEEPGTFYENVMIELGKRP